MPCIASSYDSSTFVVCSCFPRLGPVARTLVSVPAQILEAYFFRVDALTSKIFRGVNRILRNLFRLTRAARVFFFVFFSSSQRDSRASSTVY